MVGYDLEIWERWLEALEQGTAEQRQRLAICILNIFRLLSEQPAPTADVTAVPERNEGDGG